MEIKYRGQTIIIEEVVKLEICEFMELMESLRKVADAEQKNGAYGHYWVNSLVAQIRKMRDERESLLASLTNAELKFECEKRGLYGTAKHLEHA